MKVHDARARQGAALAAVALVRHDRVVAEHAPEGPRRPALAGKEVAEGAQAPWVGVGLVVARHGGRRQRCLYPCISAMETRAFRIGESVRRKVLGTTRALA